MPITLYQFPGAMVPPVVDARLYDMLSGGAVGIVQGCEITHLGGNQLQVSSGWGICMGRVFQVQQEVVNATVSTNGKVTGRLLIEIDVTNSEEPMNFVTQAQSDLPDLIQENINADGTIYQIPGAEYDIDEISISNLSVVIPKADFSGVGVYTHTKNGTVHEFTGQGANGRAMMTADIAAGDTFTVNGTPVTAYMGAESAVDMMAGSTYSGRWVTFVCDSEANTLNFKGGGGKVTVSGLSADVVKTGATVTVKQGAKVVQSVVGAYKVSLEQVAHNVQEISSGTWDVSTQWTALYDCKILFCMYHTTPISGFSTYEASCFINDVWQSADTMLLNAGNGTCHVGQVDVMKDDVVRLRYRAPTSVRTFAHVAIYAIR